MQASRRIECNELGMERQRAKEHRGKGAASSSRMEMGGRGGIAAPMMSSGAIDCVTF